jgi:regulator of sigma E protease
MEDTLRSVVAFIVVLGILVFFHELGHYLAARSRGVVVEAFSIGFGPALVSWRARSGTIWKISCLPLGGYVKMQGWGEDDSGLPARPGSFSATSLPSKALIVAAGPVANLLLAFVLFFGLFLTAGQVIVQPVISKLQPGGAAALAGLETGDRISAVDGRPIRSFEDLQDIIVDRPDAEMTFTIERAGATLQKPVRVGDHVQDGAKIGRLGVEGEQVSTRHFGPVGAAATAGQETWEVTSETVAGLWNLVVHHRGAQDLGGPLRIAQLSGQVAALGIASMVSFIAMLSINLGLVNLVPIPILDGGHLLFYAGEAIIRRPIPRRAQEMGLRFGFALLLSLFVFTTFNDLTQLGAVRWVAHIFG